MMCYEKSCRLCLSELTDAPIDCSTISELYETAKTLFEVEIKKSDNIRCICNRCFDYVMGYRALKQKITECQKIIEDYENVKKKVIETRLAQTLKQEIIDVEATRSKDIQCSRLTAVTDSDINDILAIVHDKPAKNLRQRAMVSSTKTTTINTAPSNIPPIKVERQSPIPETENRSPSLEPISSTSKDLTEKSNENEKLCDVSVGSSEDTKQSIESPALTQPKAQTGSGSASNNSDANIETVSSSIQTPLEKEDIQQPLPLLTALPPLTRKRKSSPSPIKDNKAPTNNVTNDNHSDSTCNTINCTKCSLNFRTDNELTDHMQKKHKRSTTTKRILNAIADNKANSDTLETSQSPNKTTRSSRRGAARGGRGGGGGRTGRGRQNKTPSKVDNGPSSAIRRSSRVIKPTQPPPETPNNSIIAAEPQETSTPLVMPQLKSSTAANINETPAAPPESPKFSQDSIKSESSNCSSTFNKSEKKRIITITLVRTKDCLNFRYCDQFKRNIDFDTVSPEEVEDIRKSLMIPEIWANLREAFRNSPPDSKTIEQLKSILGEEYVMI